MISTGENTEVIDKKILNTDGISNYLAIILTIDIEFTPYLFFLFV